MTRAWAAGLSVAGLAVAAAALPGLALEDPFTTAQPAGEIRLAPTAHPAVPSDPDAFWYAASSARAPSPAIANFVKGVRLLDENGNAAAALPLLSQGALASTPLGDYARYYTGRALAELGRHAEAVPVFASVAARPIEGHLPEDAAFAHAAAREAQRDFSGAAAVYRALVEKKLAAPHAAWYRLAAALEQAGALPRAVDAYRRVYYEYPLSGEATEAESALARLAASDPGGASAARELARADVLFTARRWTAARASYERARTGAAAADRDRIALRLLACDVRLGRHKQAREGLRERLAGSQAEEAGFYYATAVGGLGDRNEYARLARRFADDHPASPLAEELLNNLATAFIIADEDPRADAIFRLMIDRYPGGRFTERAFWRSGWWAYRAGRFKEAAMLFDRGAAQFPRSDYRPAWLFWSGRAWGQAGNAALAAERLTLTATDYHNIYYGRLALRRLGAGTKTAPPVRPTLSTDGTPPPAFATLDQVALLIGAGLNQEALNELQYAQRMWGSSPALTATIALVHHRLGNLRLGINAMKRAYPQWMAAGGETLPLAIQKIVFPLDYWPLLQKHAAARGLDPYLVAALVAQESTFDPAIRSSANAIGLMQVLPATGRQWARTLGIAKFSAARLTEPETNVRIGTAIFADSARRFGGVHFALAAYNAGNHRVTTWLRERQGLPQDEFIDDIPFPETQNYVKRILGTADDYRRLYGGNTEAAEP